MNKIRVPSQQWLLLFGHIGDIRTDLNFTWLILNPYYSIYI